MNDDRAKLPHHPGLDGIRGLAVAAVLAYHGGFAWAKGGYLGVSVFFTLSGFLITSLLVAEHRREGRIGLRAFWGRRFRRLLPAAIVALIGVCVFSVTVATQGQRRGIHGDVLAALAYVANWRFVLKDVSYADLFDEPSPVLHFWSLAIEEQFYVVFPLFVALVLAIGRGRRSVLAGSLALLTVGSVAASFLLADAGPDRLYFGTDTRAAELLIGALLAVVVAARGRPSGRIVGPITTGAGALAVLGLGVAASTVPQQSAWLYRGGFAAIAVVSAVAVLAAARESRLGTVLGVAPLRWLGLRSYGIYLYHWPIFLWLDETVLDLERGPLFLVRIAVTALAAEVSYHLVEMPFRERRVPRPARLILAPAAVLVVIVGSLAIGLSAPKPPVMFADIGAEPPPPPPPPAPSPVAAEAVEDHAIVVIGGQLGGHLVAEMMTRIGVDDPLVVTDLTAQSCDAPCAELEALWTGTVASADTVVILVGPNDPFGSDAAALERVRAAVPQDASVIWVSHPVVGPGIKISLTPSADLIQRFDVVNDATSQIAVAHDDRRMDLSRLIEASPAGDEGVRNTVSLDPDDVALLALVDAIAAQIIDGARADTHTTRVLVVGDSLAQTVGNGLSAWGESSGQIVTWNTGRAGCGLMREGEIERFGTLPPGCADWAERYPDQLAGFDPDVVVVLTGPWDLSARRVGGSDTFLLPGDPTFDAYMRAEYELAVETLGATGASVVWLTTPCVAPKQEEDIPGFSVARRERQREILEEVADASLVRMSVVDLDPVVCPGGAYDETVGGLAGARFDGVHFTVDSATWLASNHLGWVIGQVARPVTAAEEAAIAMAQGS